MQIRCPQCHVPFDSVEGSSWTDILCPSCGSNFSLAGIDATSSYRPGARVLGHFELAEQVGIGKFGTVWKARDTQLDRIVAIKIPRQRELDPQQTEAFLRDARAAAQLKHPRIAGVHEVGREENTVYIVTDFIDGANLQEWLTGQRLTSRESAEMVVKIAEALHHAHQAGVVHRDLKPGNIMVDRDGEPHVIDFGLARRETGEMTMTVEGQVLGTPAYMSPEQARGEGHRADRRSDIYSVGVVLFELLTGELPFRGEARMLIVQILDEEPPSPRKLNANIPRDMETITLKCLEKDPAKRYQTAQELADDLQRYLSGKPIQARPIGRLERSWRWCHRNSMVAGLAASVFAILTAGVVTSSYFAASASREASAAKSSLVKAEFQQHRAEGVDSFFTDEVFGLADPNRSNRAGISLLEALDLAASKIDERFPNDPETRAVIRDRFGEVFRQADDTDKAVEQFEMAVALRRTLAGNLDPNTLLSRSSLGSALFKANRLGEAKETLESTLADQTKVLGEGHPDTIRTAIYLDVVLRAVNDNKALELAEKTFEHARETLGPRHPRTLEAQSGYSWALRYAGQMEKALKNARTATLGLREVIGEDQTRTMDADYNYAACLQDLHQYKEAAEELQRLLGVQYRVLGPTHSRSLMAACRLAGLHQLAGDQVAALAVLEEIYSHLKSIETIPSLARANELIDLADQFAALGRLERAADVRSAVYRMYVGILRAGKSRKINFDNLNKFIATLINSPHAELRNADWAVDLATKVCALTEYKDSEAIGVLAAARASADDFDGAGKDFDKSLELQPDNVENNYLRALVRLRSGDLAGYRAGCAAMSKRFAASTDEKARYWFVWTCSLGPAAMKDLAAVLQQARDLVAQNPDNPTYLNSLGILLNRTGNYEEAAKRLTEAFAAPEKVGAGIATSVLYPQFFLAMTKQKLGDKAEAKRLLADAQTAMDKEMKTSSLWNRRTTLELFRREAEAVIQPHETASKQAKQADAAQGH